MKKIIFRAILVSLALISSGLISISQVISSEDIIKQLYEKEGEQYFKAGPLSRSAIQELSSIISIDKTDEAGNIFAYANMKEFSRFLELNIPYHILPHPGDYDGYLNVRSEIDVRNIQDWDFYPTYDAYVDMMNQFAADYPDLCQVFSIGTSTEGRQLLVAKISDNIGIRENEPQFLYTSSIHGDETTGYILMLRLIDYLLSNYDIDPRITSMVDNIEIYINPLSNPDGTYAGGNSSVNGARRYNANWIDLNRNYPDPEDGPHPDGEAWQVETVHFMAFAEDYHFVSSANIHGGTEVCNYPFDTWSRYAADDEWWQYVCHEYADTAQLYSPPDYMSDYDDGITNGYAWYTISGGRQDYMNFFHQAREFTLEISDVKLLNPAELPSLWNYNYRSLLNFMEQSTFGLRGTVKDSVTGWPLKAEVYAILHEKDSSWVYSDLPNGNYHRLLPEGNYTLRFSANGYNTEVVNNVSIVNRQATSLDILLVPEGVGGIENNQVSHAIQIYPNPLNGNIIHYESSIPVLKVAIYDLSGKMIDQYEVNWSDREINIETLKPGLYFVRFDTEKGPGMKKIVVSN